MTTLPTDIKLSSGRTIHHTRALNGSIDAIPTTGYRALTVAENEEYCTARGFPHLTDDCFTRIVTTACRALNH
jgi:hypothetical protein